ncbi:MAG: DUF1501 domain-containing protein [Gammaproteobacteria bacterium]|nr:DUF1501 domain-containing protein [Gammaproteobacteria bacterium]
MHRRDLLKLLALAPCALAARPLLAENNPRWDRIVVLLELKGANDSLNSFIPYQDPLYYQYRPKLAIPRDKIIPLGEQVGLHPALQPLLPLWEKKQLALVHGLGYANPVESHPRSIEIWNTGSDSQTLLHDGWITQSFLRYPPPNYFSASGIALSEDLGPIGGIHSQSIVMSNPQQFLSSSQSRQTNEFGTDNPALAHIIEMQNAIKASTRGMFEKMLDENYLSDPPFKSNLDAQLSAVAQLISAGITNPVYKLAHGSFDTHSNQPPQHELLLQQLAEALVNFQSQLEKLNMWRQVVVVTYCEFGRSVRENPKLGTDHGTAATHLLLGGRVNGGHYGQLPALGDLQEDQLKYNIDFRQLYSTLLDEWWNIAPSNHPFSHFPTLPIFA